MLTRANALATMVAVSVNFVAILPCVTFGANETVVYKAQVKGLWAGDLKYAVVEQSLTMSLVKQPPATLLQLQRRVEQDIPAMTAALKARGYLEASIVFDVATNRTPVRVTFRVFKGPLYKVSAFRVVYTNAAEMISQPTRRGIKVSRPAARESVDEDEAAALRYLQKKGYPQPRKLGDVVTRNEVCKTVDVVCLIDPGRKSKLGAAEITGNNQVNTKYMNRRIPWRFGDPYNIATVEELEKELLETGLFRTVRVAVTNQSDAAGLMPVRVSVVERPFRTVKAGVSYYTDEGAGVSGSWEHRNLFGGAESLSIDLLVSEIKYGARSRYTQPDFTARNADLHWDIDLIHESPDAYESDHARTAAFLEKRMGDDLTLTGGGAFEWDKVEQSGELERYSLLSVPLIMDVDRRDDELDPTKGMAVRLAAEPFEDVASDVGFLKSQGDASAFFKIIRSPQTVLAMRVTSGSISGEEVGDVPADKRFYVGGGGTVRGYKYQTVGPMEDGEPMGGNSMAAVSSELRLRLARTMGVAAFVDGGMAYVDSRPDFEIPFLWGIGGGVRYYLGMTPLRVDVAFPLNKRNEIDADFQIYVSLGQSF